MLRPPPLIPPLRFQIVEEGLYRGSFPSLKNFRFLRRLKLKTIISLTPEESCSGEIREFCSHEDLRGFCTYEDIEHVHFIVPKYSERVMIPQQLAAQVISLMIRPENLPLYIHCKDGANNTGLIVMVLRRLQNWSLSAIFGEFSRYIKISETISREEARYIESFQAEIEIPHRIPSWMWQGKVAVVHPTMHLKLLAPSPSEVVPQTSSDEANRRRQEIIQAINQKGHNRNNPQTTSIRGILLAADRISINPDGQYHALHLEGLGLEGLPPLGKRPAEWLT